MDVTLQDRDFEKQITRKAETLCDALLSPTRIYVKSLLKALKIKSEDNAPAIRGMAHITGGGLTENIPRVLPDGMAAHIDVSKWKLPAIFQWLKEQGDLENSDLARTLNCGIGMIVICDPKKANEIEKTLISAGETVYRVGETRSQKLSDISIYLDNLGSSWA